MERKQVILYEDVNNDSSNNLNQLMGSTHLDPQIFYILKFLGNKIEILDCNLQNVDQYDYNDIECINLSLCSRYAGGSGRFGGIRTTINIDIDIVLKDRTIVFEIVQPISFQNVIDKIQEHQIEIIDMIGVINIYKQYPDYDKRVRYLENHFNALAKKYHLDHPRFKSRFNKS